MYRNCSYSQYEPYKSKDGEKFQKIKAKYKEEQENI